MSDSISQDEIDALIKGTAGGGKSPDGLAPEQVVLLMQAVSRFLTDAVAAAGTLLGVSVASTSPQVTQCSAQSVADRIGTPLVVGRLALSGKVSGTAYLALPEGMALQFLSHLYGGTTPGGIGDEELGALAEGFSQMAGAGLTGLSSMAGGTVNLEPVSALLGAGFTEGSGLGEGDAVYCCEVMLAVGEQESPAALVFPAAVARSLVGAVSAATAPAAESAAPKAAAATPQKAAAPAEAPAAAAPATAPASGGSVQAQAATFKELSPSSAAAPSATTQETRNIDLLLDVTLEVTVELGRTRRRIRDVLTLGPGSIVEIDKLAGEAVDVLVNGKLIAKGEVVIIDDNYGVRISDIISPAERVQSLNR